MAEKTRLLSARIPTLTLLLVGLIAGYLSLERRTKLDRLEHIMLEGIERTIRSLNGVDVRRFDRKGILEYLAKRTSEAKTRIDDLTWGPGRAPERTPEQQRLYNAYVQSIAEVCRKRGIEYREVMTFPNLERLNR